MTSIRNSTYTLNEKEIKVVRAALSALALDISGINEVMEEEGLDYYEDQTRFDLYRKLKDL